MFVVVNPLHKIVPCTYRDTSHSRKNPRRIFSRDPMVILRGEFFY